MILEGIVMPVGELNANGWGVKSPEIGNVISTLKQSVVRLCPELEHGCDLTESKHHEIGKVIDAWLDGKYIHAKTEIYNPKAKSSVLDGIVAAWSVYGQGDQHSDGFVSNYKNKSLTLVADPAWKDATFSISASKRFTLTNSFSKDVIMPEDSDDEAKFLASLKDEVKKDTDAHKKEVSDLIAAKDKQIADLTKTVTEQSAAIDELKKLVTASLEKIKGDPEDKKTEKKDDEVKPIYASKDDLEALKTGIKSEDDIDKLVASKLAAAKEFDARLEAIASYKALAASRGLKIEDTMFEGKTSAMITSEFGVLSSLAAATARPEPVYHSIPEEYADASQLTVGIPDGKGGWKVTF